MGGCTRAIFDTCLISNPKVHINYVGVSHSSMGSILFSACDYALSAPKQRRRLLLVRVLRHHRFVEALLGDAAREDKRPLALWPPAFEASRVNRPILRRHTRGARLYGRAREDTRAEERTCIVRLTGIGGRCLMRRRLFVLCLLGFGAQQNRTQLCLGQPPV